MRALIRIAVLGVLLWSGYWLVAAYGLRAGVTAWFNERAALGWQADFAEIATSGYPLRLVTTLRSPALADPATGVAWQAGALHLDRPAIWPGHLDLRFPATPQRLSYFDDTLELTAQDMTATLRTRPGLALEVETLEMTVAAWSLTGQDGPVAHADGLTFVMQQQASPETYVITANLPGLVPGDRLRDLSEVSDTLPDRLEALEFRAHVTFDKPWDRSALETARPQPRHVDLKLADARWGQLRVLAAGDFAVDAAGRPDGTVTLKIDNWRDILDMARQSGALPAEIIGPAESALTLLSSVGGNPNALDARITLRGGAMSLGPIPLGPAPRLILR